jgi:hypothetical protein
MIKAFTGLNAALPTVVGRGAPANTINRVQGTDCYVRRWSVPTDVGT